MRQAADATILSSANPTAMARVKFFQRAPFSGSDPQVALVVQTVQCCTHQIEPKRPVRNRLIMTTPTHATVSAPGEGETYWTGFPNTIRLTGDDTEGALTVIELRVPAGFEGPPHIHHDDHQTDHILEGELVYTVGEDTMTVGEGSIVHCPKGVPHSFRNESDEEAVVLDWLHPAGHDEFMARTADRLEDPDDPPELDMQRVQELAPEYGMEMLDPRPD